MRKTLPILLLIIAVAIVHRYIILYRNGVLCFAIKWDAYQFMWPKLSFLSDSIRHGIWPLWNPYDFAGAPIFSNLQTLYFHPVILLYALTVGFSLNSLQIYLLLLYMFGATNLFVLARFHGVPARLALLLGLLYSVSGFAIGNAQHFPQLHLFMTEPLTLYLLLRYVRRPTAARFSLGVLGVSMLITGGYPSILGHLLIFNFLFVLSTALSDRARFLKTLAGSSGIHLGAVVVMAPMLIPALLSLPYITRGEGVSYELFSSHSLSWPYLLNALNPFLGQMNLSLWYHDDVSLKNCSIGLLVIVLVAYAALRYKGNRFLIAYWVLSILGCLGGNIFTGQLFYLIPILNNTRHVTFEFRVLFIVASYLLAIRSINAYINEHNKYVVFTSIGVPMIVYLFCMLRLHDQIDMSLIHNSLEVYLGLAMSETACRVLVFAIPVLVWVIYLVSRISKRWIMNVIVCVGLFEAFLTAPANYFTVLEPWASERWVEMETRERNRDKGFPIPDPFKRVHLYPKRWNEGSIYKVHSDWGMDGTVLKSTDRLVKSTGVGLYGPYMWFHERGQTRKEMDHMTPYQIREYGPNRIVVAFSPLDRYRTAVFSFMHYPGWKAFAPGEQRSCVATTDGLVGVALDEGDTELTLVFAPIYFYYLLALSLLAVLCLTIVALWSRRGSPQHIDHDSR